MKDHANFWILYVIWWLVWRLKNIYIYILLYTFYTLYSAYKYYILLYGYIIYVMNLFYCNRNRLYLILWSCLYTCLYVIIYIYIYICLYVLFVVARWWRYEGKKEEKVIAAEKEKKIGKKKGNIYLIKLTSNFPIDLLVILAQN